jgi:2-polyprenyl-3-methyl-5-hydroxy-6-metoxy-1,4-benzoquinol methylase
LPDFQTGGWRNDHAESLRNSTQSHSAFLACVDKATASRERLATVELKQSDYVLGHTDREQLRLIRQARVFAPSTEHFLRDAGISSGMRVLDIGCGMGDVTMLVAQLVGPQGSVTSIDVDQAAIATARNRASAVGLDNATFRQADVSTFADIEPFDAIVGRLVLEFLPDPGATIVHLCRLLRPGGIMAFQEPSWKLWLAYTSHLPLRMAATTILHDVFVAAGVHTEMELPLYRGLMSANLTPPQLRVALPIGDGPEFRSLLYDLLLTVWERAEKLQLPLNSLGDPKTLASRLDDELDTSRSFAAFVGFVGAFAHKREE